MWLGHFTHPQVGPADWRIFALAGKLPGYSNHMNAEQLNALRIAQRVILAGPNATYTADELGLLRRASGLSDAYGRECAQAVLFNAAARCGFFAEKQEKSEV